VAPADRPCPGHRPPRRSRSLGKARDDSLEILDRNHDTLGDRGPAWAPLLLCRPEDPAVLGFVCGITRADPHYVGFLGHTLLPSAYPGHPSVAEALEDSLRANPRSYMDSELSALAGIDHGPAMKDALLKSLTIGSFPHWAARALATRWEDDEEVRAALRAVLEGEPVRASYAAAADLPMLGREAAVERLLALIALPRNGQRRVRDDIIAITQAGSYRDEADAPGANAGRLLPPAWNSCPVRGDEYEATAESEIIAAMEAT
jgi:plasmid stability protein